MRRTTFNYIAEILRDYPKIDKYIKEREKELRNPHFESDLNNGIKSNVGSSDKQLNMLITIDTDRRLSCLELNKKAVEYALDKADEDTKKIIAELYFRERPKYTIEGLVTNGFVYCSERSAKRLRTDFFECIADFLKLAK